MKKIILSIVFVGIMFVGNANPTSLTTDCVDLAMNLQGKLENEGISMEKANEIANEAYDDCVDAGGDAGSPAATTNS